MVQRIRELCKAQGTSIAKLEKQLGFGNGVIGKWGKYKPNYEKLHAVANALGVSVSYLTGESEQKEMPTVKDDGPKNPVIEEIDNMLDGLSEEELALVKSRIQKIIESRV